MTVLVIRPAPQGQRLADKLNQQGINALAEPLLDIVPVTPVPISVEQLTSQQWVIAVSVAAAEALPSPLPAGPRYAAVGQATADALSAAGASAVLVAEPADSEGLLAQPALKKVQDEHILIARGDGGRELLASTLTERGAEVTQVSLYQRQRRQLTAEQVLGWQDRQVETVVVTSCSLADALLATTPPPLHDWLLELQLLVPSARVAKHCHQAGFGRVEILSGASDDAVLAYFEKEKVAMTDERLEPEVTASESEYQPPVASKAGKKGGSTALALLALLLAAGSLGWSGWQYYQARHNAALPQVSVAQVNTLQQQLQQLQGQLQQFGHGRQQDQQQLTTLRQQLAELQSAQRQQVSWPHKEAAMLVRMANRRLYLSQNLPVAEALLQDADATLKKLPEDSDILAWRQAIAADLANLQAQPNIDRTDLAMQLSGLRSQVDQLVLNTVKLPELDQAKPDLQLSDDSGDWRENLKRSWRRFADDFIKVRKRQQDVQPMLSPSHQAYLREALKLALDEAELAMFAGDQVRYQANLRQAKQWLSTMASHDAKVNQAFISGLDALLAKPVSLSLPKSLDSLRMAEDSQ